MQCQCPGTSHYDKWRNWRIIDRTASGKMRRVYCLKCRRTWLSSARYTEIMRTHKPDSRKGMTDQDVLDAIMDGSLIVLWDASKVESRTRNKGITELRIIERESNGSTYRFVEVSRGGKKKKIALHRLVWMARNKRLVPEGMDVDHIDGPSDAIGNLRLLPKSINRAATSRTSVTVPDDFDEGF